MVLVIIALFYLKMLVANGLHRKTNNQYDAHKVAFMALKMIETCAKHSTHDGKHIQVSF